MLLGVQLVGCSEESSSKPAATGGSPGSGGQGGTGTGGSTGGTSTGGAATGGQAGEGGSGGDGGAGGVNQCTADVEGASAIGGTDPHDHVFVLPASVIAEGNATWFVLQAEDSMGEDTAHTHTVQLSAFELTLLRSGELLTKNSSADDGHYHSVTLSCIS
jgi:hypothetical protein